LKLKPIFDSYPDFEPYANDEPLRLQALDEYRQDVWLETLRCYADGSFPASIAMASFAMEVSLRHGLIKRLPSTPAHPDSRAFIGYCRSSEIRILPGDKEDLTNRAAQSVLDVRDDMVHASVPGYTTLRPKGATSRRGKP